MTTELPTEKRFYITTKFEKYATYTYMARDEHHALELHEDGSYDNYEEEWGEYNEKIEEIELDEKEKHQFHHSIDAVKKLWDAASAIDPDLKK